MKMKYTIQNIKDKANKTAARIRKSYSGTMLQ